MRPREQAASLPGVDALARERLDVKTVDHVDLLLQWLQRLQRFAELHGSALAFRAPMIFVDAVPQKDYAKSFRKLRGSRGASQCLQRLQPR